MIRIGKIEKISEEKFQNKTKRFDYDGLDFNKMFNTAIQGGSEDDNTDIDEILVTLQQDYYQLGKLLFAVTGKDKEQDIRDFSRIATNLTDNIAKLITKRTKL